MRCQILAAALALGTLMATPQASAVRVFAQEDIFVTFGTGTVHIAGTGYEVGADANTGTFRALAEAPLGGQTQSVVTGTFEPIPVTNNGAMALTLDVGMLVVSVDGTYGLGSDIDSHQRGISSGVFTAIVGGVQSSARGDHVVRRDVGTNGFVDEFNSFTEPFETNGAQVVSTVAGLNRVAYDLVMPRIVLAPGETMDLLIQLNTAALADRAGIATADFLSTAALSMTLPAGFDRDDLRFGDGIVMPSWVHESVVVSEPATGWLVLAAAGVAAWRRRPHGAASSDHRLGH